MRQNEVEGHGGGEAGVRFDNRKRRHEAEENRAVANAPSHIEGAQTLLAYRITYRSLRRPRRDRRLR
jgi:hypothetical protein